MADSTHVLESGELLALGLARRLQPRLTMPREVVLLATHFVDATVRSLYAELEATLAPQRDVVVMFHGSAREAKAGFGTDARVFCCAGRRSYPSKGSTRWWQRGTAYAGVFPASVDLLILELANALSYDRYWFIEYDVRFSGPWSRLFDAFDDCPAGLLGTTLRRFDDMPAWPHWKWLRSPSGPVDRSRAVRAFLPIARYTREALEVLDKAYRAGWGGHFETTVPTIIREAGLGIEDIGGDGPFVRARNRNRFYVNWHDAAGITGGTFVCRPVRPAAGARADTLWHPVKKPDGSRWRPRTPASLRVARSLQAVALRWRAAGVR